MKDRLFEGLRLGLRTYARSFDFHGRSTRTEVICFWLIAMLLAAASEILRSIAGFPQDFVQIFDGRTANAAALIALEQLPLFPVFALSARRLHDIGLPSWPGPINATVALALGIWRMLSFRTLDVEPLTSAWAALHIVTVLLFYLGLFWVPRRGPNRYGPDPRSAQAV